MVTRLVSSYAPTLTSADHDHTLKLYIAQVCTGQIREGGHQTLSEVAKGKLQDYCWVLHRTTNERRTEVHPVWFSILV